MRKKLFQVLQITKNVLQTYPLVLFMSLFMATLVVYIIEIESEIKNNFHLFKLLFLSSTGISLFFGIKMLSQRIGKELIGSLLGIVILGIYYYVLPENEKDLNEMYVFIILPMYILSHLFVAFIPYINPKTSEKSFWEYNKNLFLNFILTAIFSLVLVLGVELAIAAVDNLFSLNIDNKLYPETGFFLAIFGSTLIFLLFNEKGLQELEKNQAYPLVLKFFTQFILIPLLIIYLVILYFYAGKIVLNWILPRGWVTYLVMAYSVVGILALLLVHPLKKEDARSWVKIFSDIFYFSLLPLLVLQYVAIFTRILEYGYTEARYYVLILALWISAVVLNFIFNRKASIKFIPVSLFLFGIFSLTIPYFNAISVGKRSQKNQLMTILNENKLLENGKIDFNKPIQDSVATEILNKFDYLAERKEKNFLEALVDTKTASTKDFKEDNFWNTSNFFPNVQYVQKNADTWRQNSLETESNAMDIKGYDYIIPLQLNNNQTHEIETKELIVSSTGQFDNEKQQISLELNKSTIELTPMIDKLYKSYGYFEDTKKVDEISLTFTLENYECKLYFQSINQNNKDKKYNINSPCFLLMRKK
jgi:hypothetical protein